jgi:cytochrome c nitrite reductase small subunit
VQIVQENCVRCHSEIVARISTDRNCWECHRRYSHKLTGAIATWTP